MQQIMTVTPQKPDGLVSGHCDLVPSQGCEGTRTPNGIETMFDRFKQVRLLRADVTLVRFELHNHNVIAVCQQGRREARSPSIPLSSPTSHPLSASGCGRASSSRPPANNIFGRGWQYDFASRLRARELPAYWNHQIFGITFFVCSISGLRWPNWASQ